MTREDPETDSRQAEEPVAPALPAAPASRYAYGARYEPDAPDGQERLDPMGRPSSEAWERADTWERVDGRERAGAARGTMEAAPARVEPEPREPSHQPSREPADDTRQRILSARRRLLGMLVVLFVAAASLALLRLAAWWVIVPPMIMLSGYLLLLREAAHADAVQDRRELEAARSASQARAQARAATARRDARRTQVTARAPGPATSVAPSADIIDISGRTDEEFYDQYADAKLRAVGDLGRDVPGASALQCASSLPSLLR